MNQQVKTLNSMSIATKEGDTTVTWDPADEASVAAARAEFNRLRGERYEAFRMVATSGDAATAVTETKGERMSEFDPAVGRIMMVPRLVGG